MGDELKKKQMHSHLKLHLSDLSHQSMGVRRRRTSTSSSLDGTTVRRNSTLDVNAPRRHSTCSNVDLSPGGKARTFSTASSCDLDWASGSLSPGSTGRSDRATSDSSSATCSTTHHEEMKSQAQWWKMNSPKCLPISPSCLFFQSTKRKNPMESALKRHGFTLEKKLTSVNLPRATFYVVKKKTRSDRAITCMCRVDGIDEAATCYAEMDILKACEANPFVYKFHDMIVMDQGILFITDLIQGGSLLRRVNRMGGLHPVSIRFYAAEIACALNLLHSRGITHNVLSLRTVFLDISGHVKLCDFRLANIEHEKMRINNDAKPEDDGNPVSNNDWWAFVGIVYHMLTGKDAFQEDQRWFKAGRVAFPANCDASTVTFITSCVQEMRALQPCLFSFIQNHKFFENYRGQWGLIEQTRITPPYLPFNELVQLKSDVSGDDSPTSKNNRLVKFVSDEVLN